MKVLNPSIEDSWEKELIGEFQKEYFLKLERFLRIENKDHVIFPPADKIFEAFRITPFKDVKVVILGQDPYHGDGQAHGLSFSVPEGVKAPPSLRNIFKELKSDLGDIHDSNTCLGHWAEQGVLLLNATLTVRSKSPGSHKNKGWEVFTDYVINTLSSKKENIVFILWGSYAQKKGAIINSSKHLILKSAHPSPFSAHRGFFGSKPFSTTNNFLRLNGQQEINWVK